MCCLLGIDLGTSSVKCLLVGVGGEKLCATSVPYDVIVRGDGSAEQEPQMWWDSTVTCIAALLKKSGIAPEQIAAIGFSGQMHGTVALDQNKQPIHNAILHCDARSEKELTEIYERISVRRVGELVMNATYTGMPPASLLWLRKHCPEQYERIRYVVLPKDYLRYRLTGELGTEITDAASTTLMDIRKGEWSTELMEALGLDRRWFLPIARPYELAGTVSHEAAEQTGLRAGTRVVYGAGDQPAQALGNGLIRAGVATCNIGTSGQICTPTAQPVFNPALNTNTFTHAPDDTWYIMGAQLSAGLALKWVAKNVIGQEDYPRMDHLAEAFSPKELPMFAPYLMGERTPHMNPNARGIFFGLGLEHDYRHLYASVMEGVVFSLRDSLELIQALHVPVHGIIASGGGAQSDLWMQMQADIFNREITTTALEEQANLGAAMLAAVGGGLYANVEEAGTAMVRPGRKQAIPNQQQVRVYEERYQRFRELYPRLKDLYN